VTTTTEDRVALFAKLQEPATQPEFWTRVADNVDWTVKGTHPLAGRYHSKSEFIESTFARLAGVLPGGVKLEITHLHVDGDTTIVELRSMSTTNEGAVRQ
jgi:ketosteroid isomerase-like protein